MKLKSGEIMNNLNNDCKQLNYLIDLHTEIELLKASDKIQDKEIEKLRTQLKTNYNFVITTLISFLLTLISGVILFLIKK